MNNNTKYYQTKLLKKKTKIKVLSMDRFSGEGKYREWYRRSWKMERTPPHASLICIKNCRYLLVEWCWLLKTKIKSFKKQAERKRCLKHRGTKTRVIEVPDEQDKSGDNGTTCWPQGRDSAQQPPPREVKEKRRHICSSWSHHKCTDTMRNADGTWQNSFSTKQRGV